MNLSPEVAAVLRQARAQARAERDTDEAYYILVYALIPLLEPEQDVDKYLDDKQLTLVS